MCIRDRLTLTYGIASHAQSRHTQSISRLMVNKKALTVTVLHYSLSLIHICSASQVTINISFAAKLLTEFKKFMCTKAVILYHTAPVCVRCV